MPKTDNDTAEIILEHLRYLRGQIDTLSDKLNSQGRDILSVRKDVYGFRGDVLHFEETVGDIRTDIKAIKRRLDMVEA